MSSLIKYEIHHYRHLHATLDAVQLWEHRKFFQDSPLFTAKLLEHTKHNQMILLSLESP